MPGTTVLLRTKDSTLRDTVHEALSSLADLALETVSTQFDLRDRIAGSDVVMVLLHLAADAQAVDLSAQVRALKESCQPTPMIILSDRHRPEEELEFRQLGVAEFLDRPVDLNQLAYIVDVLTVRARYAARLAATRQPRITSLSRQEPFLYVQSGAAEAWMERVKRVAPCDATVLLTGETGTGKTRLARLIHELSARRDDPFITVHCGALSASLLESELFGHVKGAFTGAIRDRSGKFAEVGRGTLLLDDIDALPVDLQAKLLRVVEEHVFEPVGTNRIQPMEARLIVASNRALDKEVAAGRLRVDLYYRLNVVGFHLSPLRERREVIAPLVENFLRQQAERSGQLPRGIAQAALGVLQDYAWPGNIRELRNVIERALALCPGPIIDLDDLPEAILKALPDEARVPAELPRLATMAALGSLAETREEAEAQHIADALTRYKNNRKRVAAELGISRMTLYKKLHRYGMIGAAG